MRFVFLLLLVSGVLFGQSIAPSVHLAAHHSTAWQTDNPFLDLQGTATMNSDISNVLWSNQMGERGSGTWNESGAGTASWTVTSIPLRFGVNRIAVTVVDAKNNSKSLHVAVNRTPIAGSLPPQPLEVRTGVWKNRTIVYQVRNGMAVVEGDIILAPNASLSGGAALQSSPGPTPDGLSIDYISQLWPAVNGVYQVPYIITGSNANLNTALANFNRQFTGVIQFVARTTQANYVNLTVEEGGSGEGFSNEGMVGGEQSLDCGSGCTVATWLHEMGHTIGLLHEQQRPDAGDYIQVFPANADLPNFPGNFTLFSFDYQTLGLYDYASVMQYGAFDFSKAGLPVIESKPAGIPLSGSGYSAGDVDQIERLYKAAPDLVTVTTNPTGLGIVVDGTAYTAPHSFGWQFFTHHTVTVAADPQHTNPVEGYTYKFGNWNDLGAESHSIEIIPGTGTVGSPVTQPAVTVYQANFIRLDPFAFQSPSVYPSGAGTVSVSPTPVSEFGGTFYTDRTLVQLTLSPTEGSGYNFYDWFNLPYPPSDNPHSFYIQNPTTEAQAVFVSTPVTIVGESITGPNTWNPGLAGSVDGGFAYLPTAFSSYYNGTAWNAGTTHSISVDQTQSPVTTNVFYNWNNWSDGGAITHNITQAASGSQTISASLTPFYATYTIPPPLGSNSSACYGGVSTSPAGVSYAENPVFSFYQDGTSVTSTATANTIYPGMSFTGWSGSLSGDTNPDMTTIHDQFVPTGLFNMASSPLTISSISPPSAQVTGAAMNITVNGTGFVSGSTYGYWNGSYRSVANVSATQLTLQLNAGDLAVAGGQDIYIGNYSTSSSNTTCGVAAETSLTVTSPPPTGSPAVVSLAPASGTGLTQTFTAVYSDPLGADDLANIRILVNTAVTGVNACYVTYYPGLNTLYLENNTDNGTLGPITPGSSSSLSNSQCTLAGAGTSVSASGNTLTVKFALTFASGFNGGKNVYLVAANSTTSGGWVQKGTWTPDSLGSPATVSLSPSSGTGLTQTFTAVYSDPNGTGDLNTVRILFNTAVSGVNACYVLYYPATNDLYLENNADNGTAGPLKPGSSSSLSNSQCTLTGAGTSVSTSGDDMTANFALTFATTFAGGKNVYLAAASATASSGWVQKGTWTPDSLGAPAIVSLSPGSGTGSTQTFTAVYSDPNGTSDLNTVRILFNTAVNGVNACYVFYYPASNALYLENNADNGTIGPLTPGSSSSLSNSQCTLEGDGSSVSTSGNDLTANFALTFASGFTGSKNVYLAAASATASSGWVEKGTWTP